MNKYIEKIAVSMPLVGAAVGGVAGALSNKDHRVRNGIIGAGLGTYLGEGGDSLGYKEGYSKASKMKYNQKYSFGQGVEHEGLNKMNKYLEKIALRMPLTGAVFGGVAGALSNKDHRVRNGLIGAALGGSLLPLAEEVGSERGFSEGQVKSNHPLAESFISGKEHGKNIVLEKSAELSGFGMVDSITHSNLKAKYDELVKSHAALQKAHTYLKAESGLNKQIRDSGLSKLAGQISLGKRDLG